MVTSLGCPYTCEFCEAGRTTYNPRAPETVLQEIEECYYKYGIREIDIFDYLFTAAKERVWEICRGIQQRKLDISWSCRSRVDTVDEVLLKEMKKAGCSRIYFGLESGNQEILNRVNKKISLDNIKDVIGICRGLEIKSLGFFLIGSPGETKETVKNTLKFAKSLDLDYVQFSKCLAKPLTSLWKEMVEKSGRDYWKYWVLGKEEDRELPRPWTTLSNRQIDNFTKWSYISYYARPAYILKHLLMLRSFGEFKRKLFAFFDMVFCQESIAKEDKHFRVFNENRNSLIDEAREKLELLINSL